MDTSAVMKLIVAEEGSTAMRTWLGSDGRRVFSSDLLRTEFIRAVRRSVPSRLVLARQVLASIHMLRVSPSICERAATLEPASLRSLDALQIAAAMEVADALEGIATYDDRLAAAAETAGIEVVAPR